MSKVELIPLNVMKRGKVKNEKWGIVERWKRERARNQEPGARKSGKGKKMKNVSDTQNYYFEKKEYFVILEQK
jgi:hypothetical protein